MNYMLAYIIKTLVAVLLLTQAGCGRHKSGDWKMVWNDEFNYKGLPDPDKWSYDTIGNAYGWGNNELQFYTTKRLANAFVDGNYLHINAIKEKYRGFEYTSARLISKGKGDWLYGKFEIRAKVPGGVGTWPAIWMLPTDWEYGSWPRSGEIDIMEHVGFEPDSIFVTIHTGAFNHSINTQVGASKYLPSNDEKFHTYSVEWYKNHIDFLIDNELVFTFKNSGLGPEEWPFDKRFHLLLNLAVGGNWGGRHGVDDSIFPVSMIVDHVRVYKLNQ